MGRGFRLTYPSADAVLADLESLHMAYVLVDRSPKSSGASRIRPRLRPSRPPEPRRFQRIYSKA
jgi:hypothetical protein